MSGSDELPEGEIDPFNTREALRWLGRQSIPERAKQTLRDWLANFRISEDDRHANFFSSLAVLASGVKSGEMDQKDEDGNAKLGNVEIEQADYLYDHVTEVERGPKAS